MNEVLDRVNAFATAICGVRGFGSRFRILSSVAIGLVDVDALSFCGGRADR